MLESFETLDCTIRDGGYINNWKFDKKLVREAYLALSKSGIDFVEIGYRGTEKYFSKEECGVWRFSPEETIREVVREIDGARLSLMADYGRIEAEDFCDAKDSVIELVRISANKDHLKGAIDLLGRLKGKGYKVSLNAMGYTNYSEGERRGLVDLIKGTKIEYFYVVDSYGAFFPYQIEEIFKPLLDIPGIKIGFHPHNSLQMAFANALEAIRCGVHIIDSTIYGMGRAAGNLPTEIIVSFLEKERKNKYNSMPLLNIIDRYFSNLQEENKWGYQLPYMLSGMFQCHPSYAKALIDSREYTIEDIWKALNYIKSKNPIGFSKPLLYNLINTGMIGEAPKVKHDTDSENGIVHQLSSVQPEVSYAGRYKNRDFLILANGPSLKEYKDKIDAFISKYNPVILGANYLGGLFKPHYHAFTNKRRFIAYIDTVEPESKLLIGQYIPQELIREYTKRDYEKIYYLDSLSLNFDIREGIITANCRTVAVLLLGVAIVMGARRVFSVGMDGYAQRETPGNFHFYDEREEQKDFEMILQRHRWCDNFINQIDSYLISKGKEGVHILTPTSYRSFYKGIENYI